jgi:hypothetical protein
MKMKISGLMLGSALAAGLFLGAGCVERRVVYVPQPVPAGTVNPAPPAPGESGVVVTADPPAPQVEVVGAAPGPEFVWMPGCWEWHGGWVWIGGRWMIGPHPHAAWVPGRWARHRHGYVWIRGYWR